MSVSTTTRYDCSIDSPMAVRVECDITPRNGCVEAFSPFEPIVESVIGAVMRVNKKARTWHELRTIEFVRSDDLANNGRPLPNVGRIHLKLSKTQQHRASSTQDDGPLYDSDYVTIFEDTETYDLSPQATRHALFTYQHFFTFELLYFYDAKQRQFMASSLQSSVVWKWALVATREATQTYARPLVSLLEATLVEQYRKLRLHTSNQLSDDEEPYMTALHHARLVYALNITFADAYRVEKPAELPCVVVEDAKTDYYVAAADAVLPVEEGADEVVPPQSYSLHRKIPLAIAAHASIPNTDSLGYDFIAHEVPRLTVRPITVTFEAALKVPCVGDLLVKLTKARSQQTTPADERVIDVISVCRYDFSSSHDGLIDRLFDKQGSKRRTTTFTSPNSLWSVTFTTTLCRFSSHALVHQLDFTLRDAGLLCCERDAVLYDSALFNNEFNLSVEANCELEKRLEELT